MHLLTFHRDPYDPDLIYRVDDMELGALVKFQCSYSETLTGYYRVTGFVECQDPHQAEVVLTPTYWFGQEVRHTVEADFWHLIHISNPEPYAEKYRENFL